MPTQIRNIPTDSATYKGGMKRLPLKRIRLALALVLTVSLSIVSLTWWFFHQRASFDRVRLSLGREGTLASVGQIEFRNDGVATLTLEEKGSIESTFDRVAFERALFRYRRLKNVAPPGPGLDAPGFSIIVDDEGERSECFIGHSRNLSAKGVLILAAGLDELRGTPYANTEDLTLTFASESLAALEIEDRIVLATFVEEAGALAAYCQWTRSPRADGGLALSELAREAITRPSVWQPVPWEEVARISSPDGALDAVAVARTGPPFGDKTCSPAKQTNLYIVPEGTTIADDSPFLAKDLSQFLDGLRETTVYAGFDIENISVSWPDDHVLLVSTEEPSIEINRLSEYTIPLKNEAARRVRIFYRPLD